MSGEVGNLLDWELLVRTIDGEVKALVVRVRVGVARTAVGSARLVVVEACIDSVVDLGCAVVGVSTSGGLLAGFEIGGKSKSRGCE